MQFSHPYPMRDHRPDDQPARRRHRFSAGEVIGPIAGFVVLGAFAAWCLAGLLRPLDPAASPRP